MGRTLLLFLLASLAACTNTSQRSLGRTAEDQRRYEQAVKQRRVLYGMTEREVLDSVGRPIRKKSARMGRRELVEWAYNSFSIYFDDDGYVVRMEY